MRRGAVALWLAFALGIWQLATVPIFGQGSTATIVNALASGLFILLFAGWAAVTLEAWAAWIVAGIGGWLVVAPFATLFTGQTDYFINDLVVGVAVLTLGVFGALNSVHYEKNSVVADDDDAGIPTSSSATPDERRPDMRRHRAA